MRMSIGPRSGARFADHTRIVFIFHASSVSSVRLRISPHADWAAGRSTAGFHGTATTERWRGASTQWRNILPVRLIPPIRVN
jgi:hypothetical protein